MHNTSSLRVGWGFAVLPRPHLRAGSPCIAYINRAVLGEGGYCVLDEHPSSDGSYVCVLVVVAVSVPMLAGASGLLFAEVHGGLCPLWTEWRLPIGVRLGPVLGSWG